MLTPVRAAVKQEKGGLQGFCGVKQQQGMKCHLQGTSLAEGSSVMPFCKHLGAAICRKIEECHRVSRG